jgi:hypothetical protein
MPFQQNCKNTISKEPNKERRTAMMKMYWVIYLTIVTLGLLTGCSDKKDEEEPTNSIPEDEGRIVGVVTDGDGIGLEEVLVEAGEKSVETDFAGGFSLDVEPGQVVLKFTKSGYTEAAMAVQVAGGAIVPIEEGLLARSAPIDLDMDEGGTVGDEVRAVVAPGALVEEDGSPATGVVSAYITPIDVMSDLTAAPGDFSALSTGGDATQLETFAMADYHFEDADGNVLNVADGETVTVEMALPPELDAAKGDKIPAWSFDVATGKWKEEGMGEVVEAEDGSLVWRAEVTHFSWWNADVPIDERDCIQGTVTDCNGDPVSGASVKARGSDYRGETVSYIGADGTYCVDIKRGGSVEMVTVGSVDGEMVGRHSQVTGEDAGASCDEGSSGCTTHDITLPCDPAESDLDCSDSALLPCGSCLSGKVVTPSGDPVESAVVTLEVESSGFKATAVTNADGEFDIMAPLDISATLKINAAGFPPYSMAVKATVEGQCPNGDSLGEITLEENGSSTGNPFENCNLSEVTITATDLDGADPTLGELPQTGMILLDIMGSITGYIWLTDATDSENMDGASSIFMSVNLESGAAPGTVEMTGLGILNSGGIIGINSEQYTVENGVFSFNETVDGAGQTLTGNVAFDLVTICGMGLHTIQYEGTFSTTIVDYMSTDTGAATCLEFTSLLAAYGLGEGWGVVTLEVDDTPVVFGDGISAIARYLPSTDELSLIGYTQNSEIAFTLVQEAPSVGTQNISSVSYMLNSGQCMFQTEDTPELVIESTGSDDDLSVGPIRGSFSATLPQIFGECDSTSVDVSGTFQAAVCAN